MSHQEPFVLVSRKDFYRALTVIWVFMWFLAISVHNVELWSTGLLWATSMAMVITYAFQVLWDPAQHKV